MQSVTYSSNCLGTMEESKCDDFGCLLVWGVFCLLVGWGFFKKIFKKGPRDWQEGKKVRPGTWNTSGSELLAQD